MKKIVSTIIAIAMLATMVFVPAVSADTGISVSAATSGTNQVVFTMSGTYDSYQVWAYETINGMSGWELALSYADSATNGASYTYTVPADCERFDGIYKFFVRAKAAGAVAYQEDVVVAFPKNDVKIASVTADGKVVTGNTIGRTTLDPIAFSMNVSCNAEVSYKYELGNANVAGGFEEVATTQGYTFTPAAAGAYVLKLTAYETADATNSYSREIRVIVSGAGNVATISATDVFAATDLTVGDNFAADFTGKVENSGEGTLGYKFTVGEPNRGPSYQTAYTTEPTFTYEMSQPGVYAVGGYVSANGTNTYDDGILRAVTVARTGKPVGFRTKITGAATEGGVTVANGDTVTITAYGQGLDEGGYYYSFLREDINGTVLLADWSTKNSINWTAARAGSFKIIVRVKGAVDNNGVARDANVGSYEMQAGYVFTVPGNASAIGAIDVTTSAESGLANVRVPVTITATETEDALYQFVVYDEFMGKTVVQGFGPSNVATWIPRRAGNFDIEVNVVAKDDVTATPVTKTVADYAVVAGEPARVAVDIETALSDISYWESDGAGMEMTENGLKITKTEEGQSANALVKLDLDTYPLIEVLTSEIVGANIHVCVSDGENDFFLTGLTKPHPISGAEMNSMIENPPGRANNGIFRLNIPFMTMLQNAEEPGIADEGDPDDPDDDIYEVIWNEAAKKGWSGEREFTITLVAESATVGDYITFKSIDALAYGSEATDHELSSATPSGRFRWRDLSSGTGTGVTFPGTNKGLRVASAVGRVWTYAAADISETPLLEVVVSATGGTNPGFYVFLDGGEMDGWGTALGDRGSYKITSAGTYIINMAQVSRNDLSEYYGWTGKTPFFLQFACEGGNARANFTIKSVKLLQPTAKLDLNVANWGVADGPSIANDANNNLVITGMGGQANTNRVFYNITENPYLKIEVADFAAGAVANPEASAAIYAVLDNGKASYFLPVVGAEGSSAINGVGTFYLDTTAVEHGLTGNTSYTLRLALETCTTDTVVTISNIEAVAIAE